jgi:hypothetical protein
MPISRPSSNHVCKATVEGFGVWLLDPMTEWLDEVNTFEAENELMSRAFEEIWDTIGIESAPQYTRDKHAQKKEIRGRKPK